jgi:multidrug transporter EmrE-like cation transporter
VTHVPRRALRLGRRLDAVDRAVRPPPPRSWAAVLLGASIAFEVVGALALTRFPGGILVVLSFGGLSLLLLAVATRTLPAPPACGTWAAGSTALVALATIVAENRSPDVRTGTGLAALAVGTALLHAGGSARGRRPRRDGTAGRARGPGA